MVRRRCKIRVPYPLRDRAHSGQRKYRSHGDGRFRKENFKSIGTNVILERGVLVFHPENIEIGNNVYIGHNTILKGYYRNSLKIGDHTWVGQACFFHSAGGLTIGKAVGIGPMVKIITSQHSADRFALPVIFTKLSLAPVVIEDGADIGCGAIILPGVRIGKGVVVGAGAVVTKDIPDFEVWAGVPARRLRVRK